MKQAIWCDSYR